MDAARIIITMPSEAGCNKLKLLLTESGFIVIEQLRDGINCIKKATVLRPDIVIIDGNLGATDGYETAKVILTEMISDVILISGENQGYDMNRLKEETGFVVLQRPLNKHVLVIAIEVMMKYRKQINVLKKEVEELSEKLNTRKEIEKAKGILMKNMKITEDVAFKKIQKQSMDKGLPMKEIAKAIILSYDI